jgi:hypothetical protein
MSDRTRQIVLWLLIGAFTLRTEGGLVAWGLYEVLADRIAAAYCVNRSDSRCHGKCHMVRSTEKERKQGTAAVEIAMAKVEPLIIDDLSPRSQAHGLEDYPRLDGAHTSAGYPRSHDHPPSSRI